MHPHEHDRVNGSLEECNIEIDFVSLALNVGTKAETNRFSQSLSKSRHTVVRILKICPKIIKHF